MIRITKGYHIWKEIKSTNLSRFIVHIPCIYPSLHSQEGSAVLRLIGEGT